jgi:hypothetical protein
MGLPKVSHLILLIKKNAGGESLITFLLILASLETDGYEDFLTRKI